METRFRSSLRWSWNSQYVECLDRANEFRTRKICIFDLEASKIALLKHASDQIEEMRYYIYNLSQNNNIESNDAQHIKLSLINNNNNNNHNEDDENYGNISSFQVPAYLTDHNYDTILALLNNTIHDASKSKMYCIHQLSVYMNELRHQIKILQSLQNAAIQIIENNNMDDINYYSKWKINIKCFEWRFYFIQTINEYIINDIITKYNNNNNKKRRNIHNRNIHRVMNTTLFQPFEAGYYHLQSIYYHLSMILKSIPTSILKLIAEFSVGFIVICHNQSCKNKKEKGNILVMPELKYIKLYTSFDSYFCFISNESIPKLCTNCFKCHRCQQYYTKNKHKRNINYIYKNSLTTHVCNDCLNVLHVKRFAK